MGNGPLSRHLADGPPAPSDRTSPKPSGRQLSSTVPCCASHMTAPRPGPPRPWATLTSTRLHRWDRGPPAACPTGSVNKQHAAVHALLDPGVGLRGIAHSPHARSDGRCCGPAPADGRRGTHGCSSVSTTAECWFSRRRHHPGQGRMLPVTAGAASRAGARSAAGRSQGVEGDRSFQVAGAEGAVRASFAGGGRRIWLV